MISVESVSKRYGDVEAVRDVSFTVREGEITGLLGPNGAGKTSTLRMMTGYLRCDGGRVLVGDYTIEENPEEIKSMIGYLPESAPLYEEMFVFDYLNYVAGVRGISSDERIDRVAVTCGITEVMHKTIGELSKGYRQRVGLAQAMIHDPDILILDEPTSGLDPNQIIEIRNLIRELGREKTVILSTHILSEVEATCDRVIILDRGSIVADDRTGNLKDMVSGEDRIRLTLSDVSFQDARETLSNLEGVLDLEETSGDEHLSLSLSVDSEMDVRPKIFRAACERGWTLYEMSRQRQSLEHIFRELTSGGEHERNQ